MLAALLLAVLLAVPAHALVLDSAAITTGGKQSDTLRLAGRFDDVAFAGATAVVLTIDHAVVRVPIEQLSSRKGVLSYRSAGGPGQLSRHCTFN